MEKITEKLLLERCSPKTSKVEQIKTLNLSKLGLKLQDLPVTLLSRLQSLEKLDLSGNVLRGFPVSLELPALRYLDLSDNQVEDVTTLKSLSSLEELKINNNLYITVSDDYKLMVLLPNLRIHNGKDVSAPANHLRFVYTENLNARIAAVWKKSFSLPDPVTAEKMSALETNFVNTARQHVKFGPSSVSAFTKWRVEILAKEYLRSLTEPKKEPANKEPADTEESSDISTPAKRKQLEAITSVRLAPRKRCRTDSPAENRPLKSILKPPRESPADAVRMSPRKAPSRSPSTPAGGQIRPETPKRSSRVQWTNGGEAQSKHEDSVGKNDSQRGAETCGRTQLSPRSRVSFMQQPMCLKPLHVLQCHSKQDSSEDFSTQLWACAFQPPPLSAGDAGESRLVATCGGDSICVIDCETGMVMKKYKVPGEEFFTLAWSTVLMSRGATASAQHCNILAAGGKRGLIKLIHPRNNVAYGEFRASQKSVSILQFNHRQGNFLFTGSYDKKIVMWDIGGLDSKYAFKAVKLLALELGATPLHICLPPAAPGAYLLAACEDGLHCYNTQLGTNNTKKRSKEMEITFPIYKKEDKDHDYHTIDGLRFLNDDIVASKNYLHGSIYLWSWSRTKAQRPAKKNKSVCAVVLAELQWTNTETPYLALNTCPSQAYIVCGDDTGRVWTYHVTDLHNNSLNTGKPILPTEVLAWPTPIRNGHGQVEGSSINSVAMDPELRYLVALSDKNMVIVWKRKE